MNYTDNSLDDDALSLDDQRGLAKLANGMDAFACNQDAAAQAPAVMDAAMSVPKHQRRSISWLEHEMHLNAMYADLKSRPALDATPVHDRTRCGVCKSDKVRMVPPSGITNSEREPWELLCENCGNRDVMWESA